ncbi:YitT family protein [Lactococcus garvieae]|uniref:YitT family protein n=1 Tax=Lactococcus garvieae TaxID=1363 RepID=UPI0038553DAD
MKPLKYFMKDMLFVVFGAILYVIGINYFIVPSHIFSSGLMGFAQETAETINLIIKAGWSSTSSIYLLVQTVAYWLMNIPAIYLGMRKVGLKFTSKTLLTSFIIIPFFLNILIPQQNLLLEANGQLSLASKALCSIIGGVFTGTGMGIIFKYGGSSGGTDILATYLSLFKGKSFGIYNILINVIVMIWAFLLFGNLDIIVMLFILIYVQSKVVDSVYNFQETVSMLIISTKEKELKPFLLNEAKRSYTYTKAISGYSQTDSCIIFLVINKEEEIYISNKIKAIDTKSFISVLPTINVYGNFFNKFSERL